VLLTGASGFVGANLARRLLRDGHDVHLLLRPGRDRWRLAGIEGEVRLHDVALEDAAVAEVVRGIEPDWVFHLAAYGAYPHQADLEMAASTNFGGTLNLAQACLAAGFEAFVNAGSSSEYGFKATAPAETEWLDPNSAYAVTKAASTLLLRHLAMSNDAHIVTLRLYSAYGPYEEPSRLIPTLVVEGLDGRLPPLVDPAVARDFVHVDDICEAFVGAAARAGQERGAVYNVGTGVQTTIGEAVEVARKALAIEKEPTWGSMPRRSWDTTCWVADARLIRERLGWSPRYSFEEGFRSTVDWFRAHPEMVALYRERISSARRR
jgi:dolichol-phosphate mannosyltransferase